MLWMYFILLSAGLPSISSVSPYSTKNPSPKGLLGLLQFLVYFILERGSILSRRQENEANLI